MINLAVDNSAMENSIFQHQAAGDQNSYNYLNMFKNIIGESDKMKDVFQLVAKVSKSDSTILINGKTGTGKGLIAKAIYKNSKRKNKPFISVNCGAIPENLLESELFGHVRGAFTGATSSKPGKFERADGGTIFLDEIGDMSHDLQVKVLKVLEENEFEQVGGSKTIKVDVRIIAATHRDLEKEVSEGNFREDLYYRLFVIPVFLPDLHERRSDIPHLINHYIRKFSNINNNNITGISDEAMEMLMRYSWPGNVRELKNVAERIVVILEDGEIQCSDLPAKIRNNKCIPISHKIDITDNGISLSEAVTEFEKTLIIQSLEKTKWVKNKAAKLLHLNRTTLVEKIKRHKLELERISHCIA